MCMCLCFITMFNVCSLDSNFFLSLPTSDKNAKRAEIELTNILKSRRYLVKLFADTDDIGNKLSKQSKLKIKLLYDLNSDRFTHLQNYNEICDDFIQSIMFHLNQTKLTDIIVTIIEKFLSNHENTGCDPNFGNDVKKDVSYMLIDKMTQMTFARACQTLQCITRVLVDT